MPSAAAIDLFYVADVLVLCHFLGRPLVKRRWPLSMLSTAAGLAVVAVVTTIGYVAGASIGVLNIALHVAACASAAAAARDVFTGRSQPPTAGRSQPRIRHALSAATLLVLLLPKWNGGLQFAAFQGNQWDLFGYLHSAIGYATQPYRFLANLSPEQALENPLWLAAHDNLRARPSVHLTFAVTAGAPMFKAHMPALTYAFLVVPLFAALSALQCLFAVLAGSSTSRSSTVPLVASWAAASAFVLGFWGQYILDINAWSQAASVPVLIGLVAVALHMLVAAPAATRDVAPDLALLVVLAAGALYLYPEGVMFHAPALAVVIAAAIRRGYTRQRRAGMVGAALGAGVASGLAFARGTLTFGLGQIGFALQERNSYWTYFQRFLFGRGGTFDALRALATPLRHPADSEHAVSATDWIRMSMVPAIFAHGWLIPLARACDLVASFAAGIAGLVFVTPAAGVSPLVRLGWSVLMLGAVFAIVLSAVTTTRIGTATDVADVARRRRVLFHLFLAVLAGETLLLAGVGQFWSAGKALSVMSPYLIVWLLGGAVALAGMPRAGRRIVAAMWTLALYAAVQIALGGYRVARAGDPTGGHYPPAVYPSIQPDALNAKLNYDLDSIGAVMETVRGQGYRTVRIEVSDIWVRSYVLAWLTIDGRRALLPGDVRSYFSVGTVLGSHTLAAADGTIRERSQPSRDGRVRYVLSAN